MEEASVKKEIVVKRLSAFKFAVEFKTKEQSDGGTRVSVIQKAPPATPIQHISSTTALSATHASSETIQIRQVIMQRIIEILLWKLLGEERLKCCGYPIAPACALLRRVVQLSNMDQKPLVEPAAPCDGSLSCFKEQVRKFLNICAPTEEQWYRFGWRALSEEAILRKIYKEELSPNLQSLEIESNKNILTILENLKLLCHWESQGFTSITKRHAEKHEPTTGTLSPARGFYSNPPKIYPRLEDERRLHSRNEMRYYPYISPARPPPPPLVCHPRPHRLIPIPENKIGRIGAVPSYRSRRAFSMPQRYR